MGVPACAEEVGTQMAAEPPVTSSRFKVQSLTDWVGLPTDFHRFTRILSSYVLTVHDFRRDSAKLMQASLALAAPKIQSSNLQAGVTSMKAYHTSQFSTLSSQLSSCPQILTDLHRHIKYILRRNLWVAANAGNQGNNFWLIYVVFVVWVVFILNTNWQKWPKIIH